jgi:hypothetical protein
MFKDVARKVLWEFVLQLIALPVTKWLFVKEAFTGVE